ncbi:MAG: hypothetical protein ACRCSU_03980 [Paracoccaceae bacterium]
MRYDLAVLLENSVAKDVHAEAVTCRGRSALRLVLSERARNGTYGIDYVDAPTFLLAPIAFLNGTIEVNVLARLLPDAPDYARGFIGLAYRITEDVQAFEAVYLRPENGLKVRPPVPRDKRAAQYYAYPDWKFDRLRAAEPDGPYEASADIGPDEWITLRLEAKDYALTAFVNDRIVLEVPRTKAAPKAGGIGLWVDIGTEGFFSDLLVEPK